MTTEFETFRNIGSYELNGLKRDEPSSGNFLSYRKFKITVELIEESNEVYIERLQKLLLEAKGFNSRKMITDEITKLKKPQP